MHQPRPYGLHAIGLPLTENDEAFVASVSKRITNLKEVSKVDSMKMVYDLPDGGYVIVQDMGGNFRVISHKPIHGKDPIFDGIATDYIPMLFSGSVTRAIVRAGEPVSLKLTDAARFRLVNYQHLDTLPEKDIKLQRFRIDYDERFWEFKPLRPTSTLITQYTQLRPTWYSGAMSEVVQIVGGYGSQDFANLPDEKTNRFERARVKLPKSVMDAINKELSLLRLPAYTGLPRADGRIQFDYKFNNTNAVGFDDKKRPWLLRISAAGLYAMPLPIVPATRTKAFKRYMQLVGDEEILAILNRFGGMPSGESFPSDRNFEAWRRAGAIIKVCNSSDFYSHISYSSACGWAINERGDEGYNTCYDYYDDEGLGYGLTYKLRLRLGSSEDYFGAQQVELVEEGPIADKVRLYLNQLIPTLGTTNDDRAILYKLRRAKSGDIYQRALGRNGQKDRDYWHNLEMNPIADHEGSITEVYRGYLYHGAKFSNQPQIKFPEPFLGGCVSHDFLPLMQGRGKDRYPNCDTIMFAYYIGNSLQTVKYFVDWSTFQRDSNSNYEKYMRAGKWFKQEYVGYTSLQGNFYSSSLDERTYTAPTEIYTELEGEDLGFDTKPFFAYDDYGSMCGTIWRNRYFSRKTKIKTIEGAGISLAICIPFFSRSSALHAKNDFAHQVKTSESMTMFSVRDPYHYDYWTYHFDLAWFGMRIKNPKGVPFPRKGNPIWVETMNYNPTASNNAADNGDWITNLPADYTWLIHPSLEWVYNGGGGPPHINTYSISDRTENEDSGRVSLSLSRVVDIVNKVKPDTNYFIGSPNIFNDYFYRDICAVVFGSTVYYNTSEPSDKSKRAFFGSCGLVDNKSAHIFIGVINE